MNIIKLQLFQENLAKDGKFILVGIRKNKIYENGYVTDKTNGFKADAVIPSLAYEKISVKIPNTNISQEEIDSTIEPIIISFVNFTAKLYRNDSTYDISCSADDIQFLNKKGV